MTKRPKPIVLTVLDGWGYRAETKGNAIALARKGRALAVVTGRVDGEVLASPRGAGGFGYDPVFYFPALGKTFAELSAEEKNIHSHRGKAFRRLLRLIGERR